MSCDYTNDHLVDHINNIARHKPHIDRPSDPIRPVTLNIIKHCHPKLYMYDEVESLHMVLDLSNQNL